MNWLCKTIKKHSIDIIIPGIECDMFLWNLNRKTITSTGAFPLLNNKDLIKLSKDKWIFYKKLIISNPEYAIPTTLDNSFDKFQVPFLLKPRCGYGSRGIIKINSIDEFDLYKHKIGEELMMQPIIGSIEEEYTVSAFFNDSSKLIDYLSLKRKLSYEGFTQEAKVVDYNFTKILNDLAKVFNPIGPTNFQFRMDGDSPKLLEINPRISSATSIRAAFGYNESLMSIDYFINNKTPKKLDKSDIYNKRSIRYTKDYIFE